MQNIPFLPSKTILSFPRPGRLSDHINSRIRSLDIDQETVEALLCQFGLKLSGRAKNLPNARRNTNLIIETNQGRKIFKKYRKDWKHSTIEFEHSILKELERVKFPAPRLVSLPDGQTWVSSDKQNFCMFDFIDGKNYSSSFLVRPHRVRMMGTSGRTLAALHKQLVGFQPKGQHHLGFTGFDQDRLRDIPWHAKKIEELCSLSSQISEPEDRRYADWLVQNSKKIYQELFDLDLEKCPASSDHHPWGLWSPQPHLFRFRSCSSGRL
jgi:Ser/Thr protein kinase RdoA (MazF antagonist)